MEDTTKKIIDESLSPISEGLKYRFSDPIILTYSVTFVIYNYWILLYFFANKPPGYKILKIQESLYYGSFLYPSLIAFFILFIFPKIAKKGYETIEDNRVQRENIKSEKQGKLIPIQKILEEHKGALEQANKMIKSLEEQVSIKDQTIGSKNKENELIIKESENLRKQLHEKDIDIKKLLAASSIQSPKNIAYSDNTIIKSLGITTSELEDIRLFFEKTKKEPKEVVDYYLSAVQKIYDYIFEKNKQSKIANTVDQVFQHNLKANNFRQLASLLDQMQTIKTLKQEENDALEYAKQLIYRLIKFTS